MSKPNEYVYILRNLSLLHVVSKLLVDLYNASKDITWEVIIRPLKSKRTQQQNKYYWVVMKLIGEYLGYTKDEVHELFKEMFLEFEESTIVIEKKVGVKGQNIIEKEIKVYPSTTKLNTQEFNQYIEEISRFMADLGFVVPPPLAYGYDWGGR